MNDNINITSPNEICFISQYKPREIELKFIAPIILNVLIDEKKPITISPKIISTNTITKVIKNSNKNNIRIVVISPINSNKQEEIEKVKKEWPNIDINRYNDCLKQQNDYFAIDVIPCTITDKSHCHFKDCTYFYNIKLVVDNNIN